jgi:hypothetical protein
MKYVREQIELLIAKGVTVAEIEAFVCQREVKSIIEGRETAQLHNGADFLIQGLLKFSYPTDVIDAAITWYHAKHNS